MSRKRERKHLFPTTRAVDPNLGAKFLMKRDLVFAAVKNNEFVYAPVNPAYDDPMQNNGRMYKYRIVKRYRYHMLCEHIPSGLKRSFTYADVLTGWCKCKKQ